jgi:hypothetical protein
MRRRLGFGARAAGGLSMLALWMHGWVSADGWIWGVDGEDGVLTRVELAGVGRSIVVA